MGKPTERQLTKMISEVDKDGSGEIDFDEFLILMNGKINDLQLQSEIHRIYDLFDADGDGLLSCADLCQALQDYAGESMTEEEAAEVMFDVDSDGSGKIDLAEFIAMISNP